MIQRGIPRNLSGNTESSLFTHTLRLNSWPVLGVEGIERDGGRVEPRFITESRV